MSAQFDAAETTPTLSDDICFVQDWNRVFLVALANRFVSREDKRRARHKRGGANFEPYSSFCSRVCYNLDPKTENGQWAVSADFLVVALGFMLAL
eukprot:2116746-Amphidinium_carterae.1